jgi:hypothetical protein
VVEIDVEIQESTSGPPVSKLKRAYTALQARKSAIKEDPLCILDTWAGSDVCSYKGVFCADSQDGSAVAGMDLNHSNLQGTLVKELTFLTDMSLLSPQQQLVFRHYSCLLHRSLIALRVRP